MKRSNVRPSVCPIDRPQQQSAAGSLLSARRTRYHRLLHGAPASGTPRRRRRPAAAAPQHGAQQQTRTAEHRLVVTIETNVWCEIKDVGICLKVFYALNLYVG